MAKLRLPGYPTSRQGWDKLVKANSWKFEEFHGKGRGGVRREYIPPPEVKALIEARQRGELPAEPASAPRPVIPKQEPAQRHVANSAVAGYNVTPSAPTQEMKDEWLAMALEAMDYALEKEDRFVSGMNKAKLVKKLVGMAGFISAQEGVNQLTALEISLLIRPYADFLASRIPKVKDNCEDREFQRAKDRIKQDKGGDPPGGNGGAVH